MVPKAKRRRDFTSIVKRWREVVAGTVMEVLSMRAVKVGGMDSCWEESRPVLICSVAELGKCGRRKLRQRDRVKHLVKQSSERRGTSKRHIVYVSLA